MRTLQLIHSQTRRGLQADLCNADFNETGAQNDEKRIVDEFPMLSASGMKRDDAQWSCGTEGFFKDLPTKAQSEFESLVTHFHCFGSKVLIYEQQEPSSILFLLAGEVNISMNSSDGRRLLLEVAGAGDALGLVSAFSGDSSGIRAEARYPCRIASMQRQDFLEFLLRHPIALQNVARELCRQHTRACEKMRILGLTSSAMAKLAHLLLEWCREGLQTRSGIQIRCMLTHEEIGEHIGVSRETVSRALADFKSHGLVRQCGSTLIVTSRPALAIHAGIDSIPGPHVPAA